MGDIECTFAAGECRGAYGVGLMQALIRHHGLGTKRRITSASGVSVGAFTAAAVSRQDAAHRLEQWSKTMLRSDLVHASPWSTAWRALKLKALGDVKGGTGSLFSNEVLRRHYRTILPRTTLACPLDVAASKCSSEDTVQHNFRFEAGESASQRLEDAVMASSAIPGVFPPQKMSDGNLYCDGGAICGFNLAHVHRVVRTRPRALLVVGTSAWPSKGIGDYLGEHEPGSGYTGPDHQSLGKRVLHQMQAYQNAFRLADAVRLGMALGLSHDGLSGETRYRDCVFGVVVSGPMDAPVATPLDSRTGRARYPRRVVFATIPEAHCTESDQIRGSMFQPWQDRMPYVRTWLEDGRRSAPKVARLLAL